MLLSRAAKTHNISDTGMKAFYAAVDPFHDKPILGLEGWPDLETGPSIVRHWKQSTTVKAIDQGGAICVYTYPILNSSGPGAPFCARSGNIIDVISDPGGSTSGNFAPTTIYSYDATTAGGSLLPIAGSGVSSFASHYIPEEYFADGPCRLIGMGVEIHDVTADIYKQGTITCFEVPQSIADKELVLVAAQTLGGVSYLATPAEICNVQRFPSNLGEIMKFPTSRQWDAKEGAYLVVPFTSHENPPTYAEFRTPWIQVSSGVSGEMPNTTLSDSHLIGMFDTQGAGPEHFHFTPNAYAPVHSRGALLTGLNENSTFTITTSFFFESFPVQLSPLLSLATPSCKPDPRALALISTVMKSLPVGVPIKDNPNGEWFWEAVETALPVLGTVSSVLFPEFSPLIAGGTALAESALAVKRQRNKQKKQKLKAEVANQVKQDMARVEKARNKKALRK
jgi:hypothetical protein